MKTLFKLIPLNEKGSKWSATSGEILPETAALHYIPLEDLVFTEKIDGINMGIEINNGIITSVQSKNRICNIEDKNDVFYREASSKIWKSIKDKGIGNFQSENDGGNIIYPLKNIIVYGELCGVKIQKGGNYFPDRKFLIFDIYDTVQNKFFTWNAVKYFSEMFGLETVPEIIYNKKDLSVDSVKDFINSLMSVYNSEYPAEGMVVRYRTDTTYIKRWIAKIRRKDFKIKN
jgi:hypothetical protein